MARASPARESLAKRWSAEDVLAELYKAFEESGRAPSPSAWLRERRHPTYPVVVARFGSWAEALRRAGVPADGVRECAARRARTREAALAALRRVGERHGGPIPMSEWDALGYKPCSSAIHHKFGGWRKAWAEAGFVEALRKRYRDSEILERMRAAASGLTCAPTMDEWRRAGFLPDAGTISARFGSWGSAWRAAGVPSRRELALRAIRERLLGGNLTERMRAKLEAVLSEGSVTGAAASLGVSEQAVSRAVRRVLQPGQRL